MTNSQTTNTPIATDEAFEIALIELLGPDALAGDKMSFHECAKRIYHRGFQDAVHQQRDAVLEEAEKIARNYREYWSSAAGFGGHCAAARIIADEISSLKTPRGDV